MEQNSKRWLGNRTESYFRDDHYFKTLKNERVSIIDRCLLRTQPIFLRTAVYETRTYGGVRGAVATGRSSPVYSIVPSCFFIPQFLVQLLQCLHKLLMISECLAV